MSKELVSIAADNFNYSAFKLTNKDWLQITATVDGKVNTMTASWGGIGTMWNKSVAFIFIRPQRFTKTLIDKSNYLTLQVLPESKRDLNRYFGKVSGANEDKIKNSKVTLVSEGNYAYFEESDLIIKCTKLFNQELNEQSFVDKSIIDTWYPKHDFHTMYVVQLNQILASRAWLEANSQVKA